MNNIKVLSSVRIYQQGTQGALVVTFTFLQTDEILRPNFVATYKGLQGAAAHSHRQCSYFVPSTIYINKKNL